MSDDWNCTHEITVDGETTSYMEWEGSLYTRDGWTTGTRSDWTSVNKQLLFQGSVREHSLRAFNTLEAFNAACVQRNVDPTVFVNSLLSSAEYLPVYMTAQANSSNEPPAAYWAYLISKLPPA